MGNKSFNFHKKGLIVTSNAYLFTNLLRISRKLINYKPINRLRKLEKARTFIPQNMSTSDK